jgi:hypothetical protein
MVKRILVGLLVLGIVFAGASFAVEKQDIVKFGEDVEVGRGMEVDSAVAIGGSVTVSGKVKGDAVAIGGSLYLKDWSEVGGNAVSIGGKVDKSPRATVRGDVTVVGFPFASPAVEKEGAILGLTIFSIISFIAFLVLVIILVAIFPNQLGKVSSAVEENLLKTFLYGLLVVILFVPVIILLAISIAGIILIPVWAILVCVAGLFGYIAAAHFIGRKILKAFKLSVKTMMVETLVGIIILGVVGIVPFVGFIIKTVISCMGLGGVVLTKFGMEKA